jgi:hypothetical protein
MDPTTISSSTWLPPIKKWNYSEAFTSMTLLKATLLGNGTAKAQAAQCSLFWCVNTYQSSVINGRLSEIITATWHSPNRTLIDEETFSLSPPALPGQSSSVFAVTIRAPGSLRNWLLQVLTFSESWAIVDGPKQIRIVPDVSRNWSSSLTTLFSPTYDAMRFLRDHEPADVMANVAKAMTTYLRSRNEPKEFAEYADSWPKSWSQIKDSLRDTGPARGTAYELRIYIAVRWGWLAFSGAVLVSTVLFFVMVAVQSASNGVAVWKSSPLALLFHGPRLVDWDHTTAVESVSDMEAVARSIRVQLNERSGIMSERNEG